MNEQQINRLLFLFLNEIYAHSAYRIFSSVHIFHLREQIRNFDELRNRELKFVLSCEVDCICQAYRLPVVQMKNKLKFIDLVIKSSLSKISVRQITIRFYFCIRGLRSQRPNLRVVHTGHKYQETSWMASGFQECPNYCDNVDEKYDLMTMYDYCQQRPRVDCHSLISEI
jgi:hypothetical protein